MYSIRLSDGTLIDQLEMNGNNYIAQGTIEDRVFSGKLSKVEISDGHTTTVYEDMQLLSNRVEDGRSWFVLEEKSQQSKELDRLVSLLKQNITDLQVALADVFELVSGEGA